MPTNGYDDTDIKRARASKVKAKLSKLGINPRSNKYNELFFRWMRKA